jgi:hypothetical protein
MHCVLWKKVALVHCTPQSAAIAEFLYDKQQQSALSSLFLQFVKG